MVFAIVYRGGCLLNADVYRPNVECHAYFSLFLKKETQKVEESRALAVHLNPNGSKINISFKTHEDLILSSPLKFVAQ